jgi:hypothetical protein
MGLAEFYAPLERVESVNFLTVNRVDLSSRSFLGIVRPAPILYILLAQYGIWLF